MSSIDMPAEERAGGMMASRHIKFSIITVVRNGKDYIRETIDSVLSQEYKNYEYIIVDGLSTDGTVDVVKSYGEKINQFLSESDQGIADAFNKGLRCSGGDYLIYLNADDAFSSPKTLNILTEKIVANDFPNFIYGDCNLYDRETFNFLGVTSVDFFKSKLKYGLMIPQPATAVSRLYFEKYGDFDLSFKIAMDFEWFLRGASIERIVHIPIVLTNVRSGGLSTTNRRLVVSEILCALKKNFYIKSKFLQIYLGTYFFIRGLLGKLLRFLRY